MTRKTFLRGMIAAGTAPTIVPNTVFGANAPSNRVTVGGIGVGGIGCSQLPQIREAGFEVVALCDLDWTYAARTFKKFPDVRKYKDFRQMMADEGNRVDAYYCGAPDHWHALISLAALKAGKHLCCVKPLTRSVEEVRLVVEAARRAGTATQVTAATSNDEASVRLYEILDAGLIGEVKEVAAWSRRPVWPQGMVSYADWEDPIPEGFDWNMWLGPAKRIPFASKWGKHAPYEKMSKEAWCGDAVYHPFNFRGWFEFGAGALGDMGCHRANTIYRALGLKWPERVEASCSRVSAVAFPLTSIVTYDYATCKYGNPVRLTWYDGGLLPPTPKEMCSIKLPMEGVIYYGTKGSILFNAEKAQAQKFTIFDPAIKAAAEKLPRTLPRRPGWIYGEWLQACKGGEPASCNFDFAQYITEFVQLGNLAIQSGDVVRFDPVKMSVAGNAKANELLRIPYQNGWKL
ncbi:MAG: Gfo/Idh/MocA family oxidoreductase [bacterium]|nr:Gfo/Idh/MocA family oxidoreductase [bacterium]